MTERAIDKVIEGLINSKVNCMARATSPILKEAIVDALLDAAEYSLYFDDKEKKVIAKSVMPSIREIEGVIRNNRKFCDALHKATDQAIKLLASQMQSDIDNAIREAKEIIIEDIKLKQRNAKMTLIKVSALKN